MTTPEQKLISNLFLPELKFVKQIGKKDSGTRIFFLWQKNQSLKSALSVLQKLTLFMIMS